MIHRQVVHVYNPTKAEGKAAVERSGANIVLPAVFSTGIRPDIVNFVHTNISKNRRQGHAVNFKAGMKHSAESWGTGRAVSRIPRVGGSGTSRNGQGAFGNMCRKGRMFAPIRIWRRWHRRNNLKQKRYAVATALAASAILPLVQARGHRVDAAPEFPLVISNNVEKIERTKEAVRFLRDVGAWGDVQKVIDTIKVRAGKGKLRNRRYRSRRGPLVVYSGANVPLIKALRNVPGVEVAHVSRLNLLQLAPGGHVGRFIIWTEGAFNELNNIFGTSKQAGVQKKGYVLPTHEVTNPDIGRVINSNEIQSAIRQSQKDRVLHSSQKPNPLNNTKALDRVNPNAKLVRETARKANEERRAARQAQLNSKRGLTPDQKKVVKERKANSRKWISNVNGYLEAITKKAKDEQISNQKLERQVE
jgi:large subunit ribosomal protein L4e